MTQTVSYLVNFIPIAVGILAFYVLSSLHLSRNTVKIDTQTAIDCSNDTIPENNQENCQQARDEDERRIIFENTVRDMLIVNGKSCRSGTINYDKEGFIKLGMLDSTKIYRLPGFLKAARPESLSLFYSSKPDLSRELTMFGECSGILLGYMLDSRLKIM